MSTRFYYVSKPSGIPQAYFSISNEHHPVPGIIGRMNAVLEKGIPFFINGGSVKLIKNLEEYGIPINKVTGGAGVIMDTGNSNTMLKLEVYRMGFYKEPQRYFFKVGSLQDAGEDRLYSLFEFLGGG